VALNYSLLRFGEILAAIDLLRDNGLAVGSDASIGPELVFGRLWSELSISPASALRRRSLSTSGDACPVHAVPKPYRCQMGTHR
jgi:hypothetical protein